MSGWIILGAGPVIYGAIWGLTLWAGHLISTGKWFKQGPG
jgi:hypothetical protein